MASGAHAAGSSSASANTDYPAAKEAALRLVARAEQCSPLLTQKLLKKGFERRAVRAVVDELTDADMVNDGRFARLWLRSRLRSRSRPDTPLRLRIALCSKGIGRATVAAALRDCLDTETETALLLRYLRQHGPVPRSGDRSGLRSGDRTGLRSNLRREGFSEEALSGLDVDDA